MDRKDQFIPHLIVSNGLAAIDFYKDLFGAEEGHRMMGADGKRLMHGEIVLDGHKVFLSDQFDAGEGGTLKSPQTLGGTCVRITIEVEDADGLVERAVAAGLGRAMPGEGVFWGARYCKIADPFVHE